MAKMQGTEDEGAGSVLKYMTKPESDSNAADWLIMTHRLVLRLAKIVIFPFFREKQASFVVFASLKERVYGKGRAERGQRCPPGYYRPTISNNSCMKVSRTLRDQPNFHELLRISIGNKNPANPTQNPTFSSYLADSPYVVLCRV